MLNQHSPLVSVIITTYNNAKYISEAIQSIIDQDYEHIEIIVVDDGSTDNTKEIIAEFDANIQYFYQKKSGIAAGKNRGVKMAQGDFFAFLDADDFWTKTKTRLQVQKLLFDDSLDMVFGYVKQFYSPELPLAFRKKYYCPDEPSPGISSQAMLIRREAFFKVGWFDEQWKKGIFNDWFLRASENNLKYYTFPDIFMMRRIHESNHGIVNKDKTIEYVRMLRASLDRKRNKGVE